MPEKNRPSDWLGRMMIVILLEKIFAMLFFASVNFIIPFSADWLLGVLLPLPGLLMIDILYGRIALYSAAGAFFRLSQSTSAFLEAGIYFFSLILSFVVVIAVTGRAEILLFYGKHPWNCIAYYQLVTSAIIAGLLVWHSRAKRVRPNIS